jgi:hypothetical protein
MIISDGDLYFHNGEEWKNYQLYYDKIKTIVKGQK